MNLQNSFTLRFRTIIANLSFLAEVECADLADVTKTCQALSIAEGPELIASLMFFDTISGTTSAPRDMALKIFAELCNALKVGQEDYWNEVVGSYDKLTNRVTPFNMGALFPDGSVRVVWDFEDSLLGFDDTLRILDNALWLLLKLQELPQFEPSEEELEEHGNCTDLVEGRITDVLFEAGLWPDSSGAFADEHADIREVLKKHTT